MDAERFRRIETIFHQALERDGRAREDFLEDQCDGDADLRREVDRWLESDRSGQARVSAVVGDAVRSIHSGISAGTHIGPYEILSLVGEGGMGSVYRARRVDGVFQKDVAIKVIKRGMDSFAIVRRFERERRILARLQHPNIAHVLDGGSTDDGLPYLVMEFIDGTGILEHCRAAHLGIRQRLALFVSLCSAVEHAHDNLVIHRDIKPGNILVDRSGTPKLLDFGIGKLLDTDGLDSEQPLTQVSILTPDYASPEQVNGDAITTRTDVYSLGAVLYEVLTGVRAHRIEKRSARAIQDAIVIAEIPWPSSVAQDPRTVRHLKGDLDNIVMRALQKDPARRYERAGALADDIRRHLEDRPVVARPDSRLYRLRKFVRRHQALVMGTAAVLVALTAGAAVAIRQAQATAARELQVRSLAKVFLFDVHDSIRDLPGATKPRQFIVETAVKYLDALAGSRPSEPELLRELAAGYVRVGDIQGSDSSGANLGNIQAAIASYRKAGDALDVLIARNADDRTALIDRLKVQRQIAEIEAAGAGIARSIESLESAVEMGRRLRDKYPADREVRQLAADVLMALGQRQRRAGDLQSSRDATTEALTILRQLSAESRPDRASLEGLAAAESAVGMTEAQLDNLQQALAHYQRAVAENQKLLALDPLSVTVRRNLAIDFNHVGDVLGLPSLPNLGDRAGAEQAYRRGSELARELYEADPKDARSKGDYAQCLLRLGIVTPVERPDEKHALLAKSQDLMQAILSDAPGNTAMKINLAAVERLLGDFFRDVGRRREAAEQYRRSMAMAEPLITTGSNAPPRTFVDAANELAKIEAAGGRLPAALALLNRALAVAQQQAARESSDLVGGRVLLPRVYGALTVVHELSGQPAEAARWRDSTLAAWNELSTKKGFTVVHRSEMQAFQQSSAAR